MKTFLFLFLSLTNIAFSQLGNFNMHLFGDIDSRRVPPQYNAPSHYSACWGYTAPDGREYGILGCHMGLQIVDITDSATMQEVYFKPSNLNFTNPDQGHAWREMKVYSHYLYAVSEADSSGIEIFDLQYLPDSVGYIGKYFLPGHRKTHTISQSGPYLYLNGANAEFGRGTVIIDLTDPILPVRRGSWNIDYVHDSRTINDTLYTSNIYAGKLSIFDVSNKDSIKMITSFQTSPNPFTHNSAVTKDRKYIFTTDETTNPPGKLKIWNIEDLSNIIFVSAWQPTGITNTIVHNIEIYGDTAVISHYQAGLRVLNISNPEAPVEIGWYDTYPSANTNQFAGCWGVFKFPSGKIIVSDMQRGLFVLKMDDPVSIQNISSEVPSSFELQQNYPNPFNPETKIRFNIPNQGVVELKIFDINGKEVEVLFNRSLKSGTYEYSWNASNFPSGVYLYKLSSDKFSITKKMVLVK